VVSFISLLNSIQFNSNTTKYHGKVSQGKTRVVNSSQSSNFSRYKPGPCFVCNQTGHKAANCYNNPNSKNLQNGEEEQNKNQGSSLLAAMTVTMNSDKWYLDSGATTHMTNDRKLLVNYCKNEEIINVTCVNNGKLPCEGKGDAAVRLTNDTRKTAIRDVAYVPNLSVNLLSVSKLSERGHTTIFSPDGCHIYRNASVKVKGEFVASATEENGMYSLNCETHSHCANTAVTKGSDKLNLCHRRLGHLGEDNTFLLKTIVKGLDFEESGKLEPCVACFKGKQTRLPFKSTGNSRAREMLNWFILMYSYVAQ
jgi:hypothetical protein